MDKKSELDCYMFYMWNVWSKDESIAIFGERLGNHIWNKWCHKVDVSGADGVPASIYSELDADKRRKIVDRAIKHYNR